MEGIPMRIILGFLLLVTTSLVISCDNNQLPSSVNVYKHGYQAGNDNRSGSLAINGPFPSENIQLLSHLENWQMGIQFCRANTTTKAPFPLKDPNNPRATSPITNDNWGWTDPKTGIPYALIMSINQGLVVVRIRDPKHPEPLGVISFPGFVIPTIDNCRKNLVTTQLDHGDVNVYKNHAYVIYEDYWGKAPGPGMMVIDLTQLRQRKACDPSHPNSCILKVKTKIYHQFRKISSNQTIDFSDGHKIAISEQSGYMYIATASTPKDIIEKRDRPLKTLVLKINSHNPMQVNWIDTLNLPAHNIQAVTYQGPDREHRNKEIIFLANGYPGKPPFREDLKVVQITNQHGQYDYKLLSAGKYPLGIFGHTVWITPDFKYAIYGDENDEYSPILHWFVPNTARDIIFDIHDLDHIKYLYSYRSKVNSVDHNHFVVGKLLYNSDFTAGLRIVDISGIDKRQIKEIAYLDTEPRLNDFSYKQPAAKAFKKLFSHHDGSQLGSWSNYPFFKNGLIMVTDQLNGLFVLRIKHKP